MLNRTLRAAAKKIKSAPKQHRIIFFLVLFLFFTALLIFGYSQEANAPKSYPDGKDNSVCLNSKNGRCAYNLEVADKQSERVKGLSGRESLGQNSGMLFVFDQPMEECIWMKEMKFNLDIIWLDPDKKVIKLLKDVPPSTYPESFCAEKTKYVIELNSGEAVKSSFAEGDQLIIPASL